MQIYFTNPGKLSYLAEIKRLGYGVVRLANHWAYPKNGIPWFLDNGAFSYWKNNLPFNGPAFFAALEKTEIAIQDRGCLPPDFVVCPDIVCGGLASLEFSLSWLESIPAEYPVYLPVQDGMGLKDVAECIRFYDGLFVGGSMSWKLRTLSGWVEMAHYYEKKCHVGRIGTFRNLVLCLRAGVDSVDSSTFCQVNRESRDKVTGLEGFRRIESAKYQTTL